MWYMFFSAMFILTRPNSRGTFGVPIYLEWSQPIPGFTNSIVVWFSPSYLKKICAVVKRSLSCHHLEFVNCLRLPFLGRNPGAGLQTSGGWWNTEFFVGVTGGKNHVSATRKTQVLPTSFFLWLENHLARLQDTFTVFFPTMQVGKVEWQHEEQRMTSHKK